MAGHLFVIYTIAGYARSRCSTAPRIHGLTKPLARSCSLLRVCAPLILPRHFYMYIASHT